MEKEESLHNVCLHLSFPHSILGDDEAKLKKGDIDGRVVLPVFLVKICTLNFQDMSSVGFPHLIVEMGEISRMRCLPGERPCWIAWDQSPCQNPIWSYSGGDSCGRKLLRQCPRVKEGVVEWRWEPGVGGSSGGSVHHGYEFNYCTHICTCWTRMVPDINLFPPI